MSGGASKAAAPSVSVLMVCMGNICRSPTAEAVLRRQVVAAGLAGRVHVDSAGTLDYHVGAPPDARAVAHGRRRGLALEALVARQVRPADYTRFDHLLAMDDDNLEWLLRHRPPGATAKIALLLSYAPKAGLREVPDPYYGGPEGFDRVIDLVEAGCAGFLAQWVAQWGPSGGVKGAGA